MKSTACKRQGHALGCTTPGLPTRRAARAEGGEAVAAVVDALADALYELAHASAVRVLRLSGAPSDLACWALELLEEQACAVRARCNPTLTLPRTRLPAAPSTQACWALPLSAQACAVLSAPGCPPPCASYVGPEGQGL